MREGKAMWSRAMAARLKHNGYFLCGAALGLWLALAAVPLEPPPPELSLEPCGAPSLAQPPHSAPDEFEPLLAVRPPGPAAAAVAAPRSLTRPRYYSTELGMRAPLMAAVLTTEEALELRGAALNATLRSLQPALRLFTPAAAAASGRAGGSPQQHWPNVVGFTDARSTLTPFHALKYLADNYLDDYHFFFLVSDDTYVNARRLTQLVSGLSVSQHVYMGVPTDSSSAYCGLHTGVLLSRSVLQQLHSSLEWCVRNAYSPHHHENLGRCVLHAAKVSEARHDIKVPCQSSVQGQQYRSVAVDPARPGPAPALPRALTAHPAAHPAELYQMHAYVSRCSGYRLPVPQMHLRELQRAARSLSLSLPRLRPRHPAPSRHSPWPAGLRLDPSLGPPPPPPSRWDHPRWTAFNGSHGFMLTDHSAVGKLPTVWKRAIDMAVSFACAWSASRWGSGVLPEGVPEGVPQPQREPPHCALQRGSFQWLPPLALRYRLLLRLERDGGMKRRVRQVELALPVGAARLVGVPYVTESARVRLVLPVAVGGSGGAGNAATVRRALAFLRRYTNGGSGDGNGNGNTQLTLVIVGGSGGPCERDSACAAAAGELRGAAGRGGAAVLEAGGGAASAANAAQPWGGAGRAALAAAARSLPPHSLLLLISPDVDYNEDFLNRVRMNTISGAQWYLPVPFARYALYSHPLFVDGTGAKPSQRTGRFNPRHTDVLSVYKADWDRAVSLCGGESGGALSAAALLGCGGPRCLSAPEPGLLRGPALGPPPVPVPVPVPSGAPLALPPLDLGAPPDLAKLLLQVNAA